MKCAVLHGELLLSPLKRITSSFFWILNNFLFFISGGEHRASKAIAFIKQNQNVQKRAEV